MGLTGSPFPLANVDNQATFTLSIANKWVKLPSQEEMMEEWDRAVSFWEILGLPLDKVFRYNYITEDPQSYSEDLRKMINKTGVVYFSKDERFEKYKEVENSFIAALSRGNYLNFKMNGFKDI